MQYSGSFFLVFLPKRAVIFKEAPMAWLCVVQGFLSVI